jgi:asparagine synthase (glutamine-hydrolysing)
MCGIVGLASRAGQVAVADILEMSHRVRHRGPDDEGYLAVSSGLQRVVELAGADSQVLLPRIEQLADAAQLILGHRRLAVLDLSTAGHQPMATPSRDRWIVYNGEAYNYRALRAELQAAGYKFTSQTDTEVVLAAYDHWGVSCVDHLDGMWSFVVYDHRDRSLFGARDRVGVKPMYYAVNGQSFSFASEIKALLDIGPTGRALHTEAVFDLLVFGGLTSSQEDLFEGVLELLPGHAFRLDLRTWRLDVWRHYRPPDVGASEPYRADRARQLAEQTRVLLTESVRQRMRADVPLGSCLSGGIDSSTIACLGALMLRGNETFGSLREHRLFTASYLEPEADERRWAGLVAEHVGASWHQVYPQPRELLDDLEDLAFCQDLPFMAPSQYSQYRVMRLAREHGMTVLLDGQGGDELFTGYSIFYEVFLYDLLTHWDLSGFVREWCGLVNAPIGRGEATVALAKQIRRRIAPSGLVRAHRRRRTGVMGVLATDFWRRHRDRWELLGERDFRSLNEMLLELFTRQKLGHLMRYEDRNSMRFSIESRIPLADDRELSEFTLSVPAVYKIHNGWSKALLRAAMHGVVPNQILTRRDKKGFATPARRWLDELWPELRPMVEREVREFVEPAALRAGLWLSLSRFGQRGVEMMWRLISFAAWRRAFRV